MSRREPDRKGHRFKSWRALFILKGSGRRARKKGSVVFATECRPPTAIPLPRCLQSPPMPGSSWFALPLQPLGLIISNSIILGAVIRAIMI